MAARKPRIVEPAEPSVRILAPGEAQQPPRSLIDFRSPPVTVKFKKLRPTARVPERKSPGASGFDLYAVVEGPPGSEITVTTATTLIQTGLAVAIPQGYELQIRGRSGMAFVGVQVHHGTIDSDYRGEIGVLARAVHGPAYIKDGDRIAQAVLAPVLDMVWHEVAALDETVRGNAGYGSTGVRG